MTQTVVAILILMFLGLWYSWRTMGGAHDHRHMRADPRSLLTPVVYVILLTLGAALALLWWG
jgi:ABC-type nickel/cobalt efflux system permease component RcnA